MVESFICIVTLLVSVVLLNHMKECFFMTQKRISFKPIIAVMLIIALSLTALAGCGAQVREGEKDISVSIVYKDGTSKDFDINTDAEYLADALAEEGLIEYADDGFYTTVDGVTADYSVDMGWWCITKDGKITADGLNTLAIADGDKFEITYTIG